MRILVILKGYNPKTSSAVIGGFRYEEDFKAYLWKGEPLAAEAFNAFMESKDWKRAVERHGSQIVMRMVPNTMWKARKALAVKMQEEREKRANDQANEPAATVA